MELSEFNGAKYKNASFHQKEWGMKIISEFKFAGNEHILDLGCGDGVLTEKLAKLVPNGNVIGIDSSKSMLETASYIKKPNLKFILLDALSLNFQDEFDLVFSNATLHWIKNHKILLFNIYKSLKKSGFARINFGTEGNCFYFFKIVKEVMSEDYFKKLFEMFEWPWYMPNEKDYKKLVTQFSFRKVEIWIENADWYFPNKEEIIKWIEQPSICPFLKVLPEGVKKKFRDRVIEKMLKETKQKNNTYFEQFRRINIRATK